MLIVDDADYFGRRLESAWAFDRPRRNTVGATESRRGVVGDGMSLLIGVRRLEGDFAEREGFANTSSGCAPVVLTISRSPKPRRTSCSEPCTAPTANCSASS